MGKWGQKCTRKIFFTKLKLQRKIGKTSLYQFPLYLLDGSWMWISHGENHLSQPKYVFIKAIRFLYNVTYMDLSHHWALWKSIPELKKKPPNVFCYIGNFICWKHYLFLFTLNIWLYLFYSYPKTIFHKLDPQVYGRGFQYFAS